MYESVPFHVQPAPLRHSPWRVLASGDRMNGAIAIGDAHIPPRGRGPGRHVHTHEDEVFVVLDGDVSFDLDGRRCLAGPGTSVFMPRGIPHTFRVESPVACLLGVIAPGAFEQLFRNLSVPAGERALPRRGSVPFDVAAVMAEQMRLGTEVVGPPMSPVED